MLGSSFPVRFIILSIQSYLRNIVKGPQRVDAYYWYSVAFLY